MASVSHTNRKRRLRLSLFTIHIYEPFNKAVVKVALTIAVLPNTSTKVEFFLLRRIKLFFI